MRMIKVAAAQMDPVPALITNRRGTIYRVMSNISH